MEFALSDDQRMLQASVAGFAAHHVTLADVRAAAHGDAKIPARIAAGLADLGLPAMLVPTDHGGLGLGLVEAVVVQEILGAMVSPAGILGSAVAALGIATAATEDQKAGLLPAIASGEKRFAIALSERVSRRDGAGVVSGDGRLNGTALFVLEADMATDILVADQQGSLHCVASGAPGVEQKALRTIDGTRSYGEFRFNQVEARPLNGEANAGDGADRMIAAARVLIAADSLGAAQHMLDAAVAYAGQREQFGRVIGSFQAVKHMCAEMAAKLEPSRALVWHAAYALDSGDPEGRVMAALAKAHLAEVAAFVARTATEVHGGMGFTDLLGLHFWFKRIGANRQLLGGPEKTRADAARMQGWG